MSENVRTRTAAVKRAASQAIPVAVTTLVDLAQATGNNPGGSPGAVSLAASIVRRQIFGA